MDLVEDNEMMSIEDQVLLCIKENSNSKAKLILEKNPHLCHLEYELQSSLLHYCVINNNLDVLEYLLSKECTVDYQDNMGRTPLMVAVQSGFDMVAYRLLCAGADIDSTLNTFQQSVLHLSFSEHKMSPEFYEQLLIAYGKKFTIKENMVKELIKFGINLYQAVALRDVSVIRAMITDFNYSVNSDNYTNNTTALHYAVYFEEPQIVELLLEKGASATAVDDIGREPMHFLYYNNPKHNLQKLEILKTFINFKDDMTFCASENSYFPIAATLALGSREVIRLVLQSCPDFSARDEFAGNTILHYLVRNKNPGVIDELKVHINKMDVNALNKKKSSPIFYALRFRSLDMVEFLLENNATINFNFHALTFFGGLKRVKFFVSYFVMIEQRGIPLPRTFWSKVNSVPGLKKYYKKCQQVLNTKICGAVTVSKLFAKDSRQIASYLNQKQLRLKLNRMKYMRKVMCCFPYYNKTASKHLSEGRIRKALKEKALITFCKIHEKRIGIVVDQITNYMSNHDLHQFCQV